jgi:hypothetical protein
VSNLGIPISVVGVALSVMGHVHYPHDFSP